MNLEKAKAEVSVNATVLTWLTVHGNLCLSLRHPQNRGESRALCIDVVRMLSKLIVEAGVMTQAEMDQANRLELQEGSDLG